MSDPHSDPDPEAIAPPGESAATQAPDFVEAAKPARTTSRQARRRARVFDAVVTFESADGYAQPIEARTRVEGSEVDDAARRAVLRALGQVGQFDWASVVLVLTKVTDP